ncbi:MAG: hypothetical protein J6T14_04855, partial [Clostridia bacterium]|nr:hypothetical protein [Clostridia bacterium]
MLGDQREHEGGRTGLADLFVDVGVVLNELVAEKTGQAIHLVPVRDLLDMPEYHDAAKAEEPLPRLLPAVVD